MANQDVIRAWVTALRSGQYKQVDGKLRKERGDGKDGFCCLGVLCELAVAEGVIEPAVKAVDGDGDEMDYFVYSDGYYTEADSLPYAVRNWAGLPDANPDVHYVLTSLEREDIYGLSEWDFEADRLVVTVPEYAPTTHRESLAELNDTHNRDFLEIADAIEAEFLSSPTATKVDDPKGPLL